MPARLLGTLAVAASTLLLVAAPALASLADEVSTGRSVAAQVRNGDASCSTLSTARYEELGEYVMDRIVRSRAAHAAMNQRMNHAMGTQNADRMHELMGRSFAGCASTTGAGMPLGPGMMAGAGAAHGGWGTMLRASAWSWMHDGSWPHMSPGDWRRVGHSMMGSGYVADHHGWSAPAVIGALLGAALLVTLLVGRRPGRRPPATTRPA